MDLRISTSGVLTPESLVNAWGAALRDGLSQRYAHGFELSWTQEEEASQQNPPVILHWLTLKKGPDLVGRIRLAWESEEPGLLRIHMETEHLPEPPIPLDRFLDVLAVAGAILAFGGWIWFVIQDWHRVWNRVSSFAGGYDAEHATKLEVFLVLVGWAMAPITAIFLVEIVRGRFKALGQWAQRRRVQTFAQQELEGVLTDLLQKQLQGCQTDAQACLRLGQAHPGSPHPVYPNILWAGDGKYQPAEGFQWVSESPECLDVIPKP